MVSSKISKSVPVIIILLVTLLGFSSATTYKIEWNDNSVVDFKTSSSGRKYHVGDVILFKYAPKEDSVMRVTHKDYRSCNTKNPIKVMNSGKDHITISSLHTHLYFISGIPGHCEAGQKLDFKVSQPSSHQYSPSQSNDGPAPAPGPSSAVGPSLSSVGKALVALPMIFGFLFH